MECVERLSTVTVFLMFVVLDSTGMIQSSQLTSGHQYLKKVSWKKCAPGEYRDKSLSSKNQTKCVPCKDGTYTEMENSLQECRKCYGPCIGNSVQTVACSVTTNRKCECASHYYCATEDVTNCENCKRCDSTKGPPKGYEDHYRQACQPCSSGTFLNTTRKCQPHTNCTALGMILRNKGNSTADNSCATMINSLLPNKYEKITSSFNSYTVWIMATVCILCVIVILRTSRCKTSSVQGIGMLVKLRFICICDTESTHGKSGDNEEEIKLKTVPETGRPVNGSICNSKPRTPIALTTTDNTEAPTLEYRSEILDIETVSGIGSTEDNIPFPVQENGRNSNTYYPIEEQSRKQYYQPVVMEAKSGIQTSPYLHGSFVISSGLLVTSRIPASLRKNDYTVKL